MSSVIKPRKSTKPIPNKMPNRKVSGGFPNNFDGVHANPRIVHTLLSVMGKSCEAQVRNGGKYLGVFHSFNDKLDVSLSVAHLSKTSDENPKTDDLMDDLVIHADKIVVIKIPNVDLSFAETDSVQANGEVNPLSRNNSVGKDLQPWNGGIDGGEDVDLDGDMSRTSNGWHPDEMFHTNQKKFGVQTTYDESLEQYTVKMDIGKHNEDKIKWASKLANDIESSDGHKHRADLELDETTTEEDKFSAVVRQPPRDQPKTDMKTGSGNNVVERRDSRGNDNVERRDSRGSNRDMKDNNRFTKPNGRGEPWSKPRYSNGGRSPQGAMAPRSHGPMSPTDSPTNSNQNSKHKPNMEKPPRFANKNPNQSHSRPAFEERHTNQGVSDNMMRKNERLPRRQPSGQSNRGNAWGGHGNSNQSQDYHSQHSSASPHGGNKIPTTNHKNMGQHGPNPSMPSQVPQMNQNQQKGKDRSYQNLNRPITSALPVSTKSHSSPAVAQSNYPSGPATKGSWSEVVSTAPKQPPSQQHIQMHHSNAIPPEHFHIMNSEKESYSFQVKDPTPSQYHQQAYPNMPQRMPIQQHLMQQNPARNIPQPQMANTYPVSQPQPPLQQQVVGKPQQQIPLAQTQVSSQISAPKQQPKQVPKVESLMLPSKPDVAAHQATVAKKPDEQIDELKRFSQNFKLDSGDKSDKHVSSDPNSSNAKSPPRAKEVPKPQKTENVQRIPVATDNINIRLNDDAANNQPTHHSQNTTQPADKAQSPISAVEQQKPTNLPQDFTNSSDNKKQVELNPDAKEFKPTMRSEPVTPVQGLTAQPVFPVQHGGMQYGHGSKVSAAQQYMQPNQGRLVNPGAGIPPTLSQVVYDQQQMANYQAGSAYSHNMYMLSHSSPTHVPQNIMQPPLQMNPNYSQQFEQTNQAYVNRQPPHPQMMQQQRVAHTPHSMAHHYQGDQGPIPPSMYVPSTQQGIPTQFPPAQPITVARPNSANSVTVSASSPAQPQVPVGQMYYPPNGQQGHFMMQPPMMNMMPYPTQHQRQYQS